MATFSGTFGNYTHTLTVNVASQNVANNTTTLNWSYAIHRNVGAGSGSWNYDGINWSVSINGSGWSGKTGFDFRDYADLLVATGSLNVVHNSDGNKTISSSAFWGYNTSNFPGGTVSGNMALPRIPKAPTAPGTPVAGAITTTAIPLTWAASSDNNGAAITSYEVQRATNAAFTTGVVSTSFSGTTGTLTLPGGSDFWFRVRAINSVGPSAWSGVLATATLATAPASLNATSETPTSFTLGWTAPSGTGITSYRIQQSTAADFSGATTWDQAPTSRPMSGLAPAETYYYRVAALTASGWSAWSTVFSIRLGLPAPTLNSAATETTNWTLRVAWGVPAITTGLTGYRIQTARNADFTSGVENTDVGNVLTADITRTGGRRYWVRVAARTIGGANTWSSVISLVHTMDAGQLDGWTRLGTRPAGITYYTLQGLRRGPVGSVPSALNLESLATASASLPANTFGIQRTATGLKNGASYLLQAKLTGRYSSAPDAAQGRTYRLAVGSTLGTPVAISGASETITLPELEFVASGTTADIKILLADALTITGAKDEVEQVAIHNIVLWELASDYPQRLRSTVYESNLANHFDLACNSVGASWYVDKEGITRFNLPGAALPLSAVFSDTSDNGALEYIDINASYDTRSMVNRVNATNYGIDDEGVYEQNDSMVEENLTSITAYGSREERLDVNLWSEPPYTPALANRLAEILDAHDEPELLVSSLRWNAQQDITAATKLEVGQRIAVHFNGHVQNSQIVNIQHDITPTRWIVTLEIWSV